MLTSSTPSTDLVRNVSDEIWYICFESLRSNGSGLASYCREVIKAAHRCQRPIRIFEISNSKTGSHYELPSMVERVFVSDAFERKMEPLGYWMNLAHAMAQAVIREIGFRGAPRAIEIPDGFAIGYFLLQEKLTGNPALRDVPVILVAHTPVRMIEEWNGQDVHALPNWWTYRAEKWCYLAADAVITLSEMLERQLDAQGYLAAQRPVYRSVNPYISDQPPAAADRPAHQGPLVVGMASRMVDWKGLREALALAQAAQNAQLPFRLELCGHSHPDFDRARKDFAQLFENGTAVYLGALDARALHKRRQGWDCQIHPSKFDNFPYSVVEALTLALPCLIGRSNGVAEVLPPDLSQSIVVDFANPLEVLAAVRASATTRIMLKDLDLTPFGAEVYFKGRDAILADLADRSHKTTLFPFLDSGQAKTGLRPIIQLPASATGARLTVVIPYYNMAAYISPCIASVLGGKVPADIVLVNDGSTDPTSIRKLDEFRNDPRIRVHDIPNGGVANARNYGVDRATTEFVALLDADDTVEPDYYAKALRVLDDYDNVGFVGCWCNDFQDETGETIRYWPTYNAEPLPNIVTNNSNCQAMIYRRNLYIESGRHDPGLRMYLDDWDGMLGMLEGGYFGVMLPGPYFNYRQRKGSIFSTGRALWSTNYSAIVRKRAALYARNAGEALLFSNANGPNNTFHLLGWETPLHSRSASAAPGKRLRHPYLLARSLAKRLNRFAERG